MPEHTDQAEVPSIRPSICLGSRDWDLPGWVGSYYPPDLPTDWRLTYYANDFSLVLVPQGRWVGAGPERGRAWRNEVSERFRFYLELSDLQPWALKRLPRWADALGTCLGGILVSGARGLELDSGYGGAFFQALSVTDPTALSRLPTGPRPVAVVTTTRALGSLREQRSLFSALVGRFGAQGPIPVFVNGDPPPARVLLDARELTQLMGLA